MSLFPDQYHLCSVFLPDDNNATKVTTYPVTADFQINLNIIRIDFQDAMIEAEQLGEYRANAYGTDASRITEAAKIKDTITNLEYIVVNKPRYNKLFNRYKLNLKPANF